MNLIPIHTRAIAPLLLDKLQQIVNSNILPLSHSESSMPQVTGQQIPLYRAKQTYPIVYISPIALKLGKTSHPSPMEIATAIARHLCDSSGCESRCCLGGLEFTLTVVPPGKIYWQLTDRGIATWLQRALSRSWGEQSDRRSTPNHQPSIFPIQYAHARCCALLRLGHQEGLIALENANFARDRAFWHLKAPDPIPWLDPQGQLHFVDPAERILISQLIDSVDALDRAAERSPTPPYLPVATALSQDFLTFYREIQIFGAVKIKNPDLTAARLGAIALTGKILKLLLEEGLGALAPVEL